MRRVHDFEKIKHFQHHAKHRRSQGEGNQSTAMTPWEIVMATTTKIDYERLKWPGLLYVQMGVYDPRPRLVQHGRPS